MRRSAEIPTKRSSWNAMLSRLALVAGFASISTGCITSQLDVDAALEQSHRNMPNVWTRADEVLPLSTKILDLIDDQHVHRLVTEALEANPDLRAAARRLAASIRLDRELEAQRWPFIEARVTGGQSHQRDAFGEATAETHRAVLGIAWEVDLWQRLAELDEASSAQSSARAADFAAARDALGVRVIHEWVSAVSLRQVIAIEEERVEILERLQSVILRRFRRGLGTLDDLAAARSSTDVARATVAALQGELDQALRSLEVLLGRTPQAELVAARTLPTIGTVGTGYPADMLAERPDVAAALWRLEAADSALAAAGKAMLPSLRLTGEFGRETDSLAKLLSSGSVWSVIGSLTQPIFQHGLLKVRAEARRFELEAAWEDYRATVLRAIAEVENALGRDRSLHQQQRHLDRALHESSRNLQVFTGRYRRGLANILDLLQAKDQEMTIRRHVIEATSESVQNRITLALALGAGFEESPS